jgi:hypothetical protein
MRRGGSYGPAADRGTRFEKPKRPDSAVRWTRMAAFPRRGAARNVRHLTARPGAVPTSHEPRPPGGNRPAGADDDGALRPYACLSASSLGASALGERGHDVRLGQADEAPRRGPAMRPDVIFEALIGIFTFPEPQHRPSGGAGVDCVLAGPSGADGSSENGSSKNDLMQSSGYGSVAAAEFAPGGKILMISDK